MANMPIEKPINKPVTSVSVESWLAVPIETLNDDETSTSRTPKETVNVVIRKCPKSKTGRSSRCLKLLRASNSSLDIPIFYAIK